MEEKTKTRIIEQFKIDVLVDKNGFRRVRIVHWKEGVGGKGKIISYAKFKKWMEKGLL